MSSQPSYLSTAKVKRGYGGLLLAGSLVLLVQSVVASAAMLSGSAAILSLSESISSGNAGPLEQLLAAAGVAIVILGFLALVQFVLDIAALIGALQRLGRTGAPRMVAISVLIVLGLVYGPVLIGLLVGSIAGIAEASDAVAASGFGGVIVWGLIAIPLLRLAQLVIGIVALATGEPEPGQYY